MKPVTIYRRVSTAGQAADGVSLDAQEAKARAWAEMNGAPVTSVREDVLSGKKAANRPGLLAALDEVCSSGGVLVVYSLSRLARSTKDAILIAERLEKAGADLVSLSEKIDTTSAAGKMVFRMLAVLAEFERDLISERTKAALAHKKTNGERVGQIPFGSRLAADGVHLIESAEQKRAIAAVHELRAHGRSYKVIAAELNARGFTTQSGKAWTWRTVQHRALAA